MFISGCLGLDFSVVFAVSTILGHLCQNVPDAKNKHGISSYLTNYRIDGKLMAAFIILFY